MWTRVELKDRAKIALKNNYWKLVLVSLIAGAVTGSSSNFEFQIEGESTQTGFLSGLATLESIWMGMAIGVVLMFLVILAIAILVDIFVFNPLEIGTNRFFIKAFEEDAGFKELMFAYDNGYKNVVKILFMRDLKVFLWSLLLIIPGIVKAYEYRMVPYLLAEHPNLSEEEVFHLSREMMDGNKGAAFVLDWSFFGWELLSGCTFGLLGIFYVQPYKCLTNAALYTELSSAYRQSTTDETQMGYEEI